KSCAAECGAGGAPKRSVLAAEGRLFARQSLPQGAGASCQGLAVFISGAGFVRGEARRRSPSDGDCLVTRTNGEKETCGRARVARSGDRATTNWAVFEGSVSVIPPRCETCSCPGLASR